jgi:uncharacterized protein (TIGR02453 family)
MATAHFSPALFAFLTDLKAHNAREWFNDNKARFISDVEAPMMAFITDLAPKLRRVSAAIVVDPRRTGGSMFRIYRDTRFSGDKAPYKTHVSAQFRHVDGGRDVSAPGFYVHLEPRNCLGGGGIYHPDTPALTRVRQRMLAAPKEWRAILALDLPVQGDQLKRVPAGYDPAHAFATDFKWKDLYSMRPFTQKDVCSSSFVDQYVDECRRVAPLVAFVARALDLRW